MAAGREIDKSFKLFTHLDNFIAWLRFRKVKPYISSGKVILDIGCGYKASFLQSIANLIKFGYGLDIKLNQHIQIQKLKLIHWNLDEPNLPNLPKVDIVTGLAILEHLKKPTELLRAIYQLLKDNGQLIITTPSSRAEPILELLAFRLKIISAKEILDHKRYFTKSEIINLCEKAGFSKITHHYFELGLNHLVVAGK